MESDNFPSEFQQMERFKAAWQEMTEALEAVISEGVHPADALKAVGVEVPPFAAPMLEQFFSAPQATPLPE